MQEQMNNARNMQNNIEMQGSENCKKIQHNKTARKIQNARPYTPIWKMQEKQKMREMQTCKKQENVKLQAHIKHCKTSKQNIGNARKKTK